MYETVSVARSDPLEKFPELSAVLEEKDFSRGWKFFAWTFKTQGFRSCSHNPIGCLRTEKAALHHITPPLEAQRPRLRNSQLDWRLDVFLEMTVSGGFHVTQIMDLCEYVEIRQGRCLHPESVDRLEMDRVLDRPGIVVQDQRCEPPLSKQWLTQQGMILPLLFFGLKMTHKLVTIGSLEGPGWGH